LSLISNFEVRIKKIEKNIPTRIASKNSATVTRNTGNKNISAPVLIKIGGSIIFLDVAGFAEDFTRIIITTSAIKIAAIEDSIIIM
jgi:hypothetical protein